MDTISLGGTDTNRLYLRDLEWVRASGERVVVRRSLISDDPNDVARLDDMIARHIARYSLVGLFCRPAHRVLDFPCGTGYATDALGAFGVRYEGLDVDPVAIEYARLVYGGAGAMFNVGDLTRPQLEPAAYDVIGCIEGIEHIGGAYHRGLIAAFKQALKPGGVLIVSSPQNPTGRSGPSTTNQDHVWELTRADFVDLLGEYFPRDRVEIVTHQAVLDPGGLMTCLYGICHNAVS
jgi:2-polyprenyl-3-methyl-5-hydroxy-6-metoxy-1,4-benzoquinol methylase